MTVLPALVDVLTRSLWPRGKPLCARALEPALDVRARPVDAAHARNGNALVNIDAMVLRRR
jgi:hypothetical protein